MSKKNLYIGLAGLVAVIFLFAGSDNSVEKKQDVARVLFEDVNGSNIARIHVDDKTHKLDLKLKDNTWVLPASYSYPVDLGKVRSLLLKLLDIRVSQKITDDKSKFSSFGLSDECAENCSGVVRLYDAEGKSLAGLILGKLRNPDGQSEGSGQYVRKVGDNRVYLISEALNFDSVENNWLNTSVVNVLTDNIVAVDRFSVVDGQELKVASFSASADGSLVGKEDLSSFNLNTESVKRLQGSLENITFISVLPAQDSNNGVVSSLVFDNKTSFLLRNNVWYNVWGAKSDGKFYVKLFLTLATENDIKSKLIAQQPDTPDVEANEKSDLSSEPKVVAQKKSGTKTATAEDIQLLNNQLSPWIFEISEVDYVGMFLAKSDFVISE